MTHATHTIEIGSADGSDCPEMTSEEFNRLYIDYLTSDETEETIYRGTVGGAVVTINLAALSKRQAVDLRHMLPYRSASYVFDVLERESAEN